ncbi:MAG: hypothetical protein M3P98_04400 [bacterium]|nr:hypothetical protein [bacterium]
MKKLTIETQGKFIIEYDGQDLSVYRKLDNEMIFTAIMTPDIAGELVQELGGAVNDFNTASGTL